MAVAVLLSRLDGVRSTGRGKWIAKCPAHADRTPSLSIREGDDGRVLVHCFGGCEAADVIGAVGLQLSDLFEKPLYHRAKPIPQPFTAADALRCLTRETAVVALSLADMAEGRPVDRERVALAAERIADAASYVGALR
ncbi:MAG TPA: hypothetical protein VF193_01330 [Steroidobacter sp.]